MNMPVWFMYPWIHLNALWSSAANRFWARSVIGLLAWVLQHVFSKWEVNLQKKIQNPYRKLVAPACVVQPFVSDLNSDSGDVTKKYFSLQCNTPEGTGAPCIDAKAATQDDKLDSPVHVPLFSADQSWVACITHSIVCYVEVYQVVFHERFCARQLDLQGTDAPVHALCTATSMFSSYDNPSCIQSHSVHSWLYGVRGLDQVYCNTSLWQYQCLTVHDIVVMHHVSAGVLQGTKLHSLNPTVI